MFRDVNDLRRLQAYATVMYENFSPEISSIHAMLRVNGRVSRMRIIPLHHPQRTSNRLLPNFVSRITYRIGTAATQRQFR